ncbi:MAG TPA: GNAT family N-acetyltransferase [Candidatus Avoscillospira avicola]|uniref:GNAT family N-acetyltransferase n=1 Tax=Candidatus Avoscillospira avicola TaxID=2840706 RepID=A0A9D1IXB6_9FIRM|nr:GNAT family N-acetyltransferase [Candidatus Avoscillospira avicola]
MEFQTLSQEHALCIADTWHYDGIYEFYDMTADPEDYAEFVDEIQRSKNDHYEALQDGALVGFFSVERQGATVELGLGLRPDLCGKGLGRTFVREIIAFLEAHYTYDALILKVAQFNQRARRVYQACGFRETGMVRQESNGGIYDFVVMEYQR